MIIDIMDEGDRLNSDQYELIERIVKLTAERLSLQPEIEVDISIVTDREIHELNLNYRGIDRPTDVLSFALEEGEPDSWSELSQMNIGLNRHLGDIIISYDQAVRQAEEYRHSLDRELAFLTVHGFLHLNGYDHQTVEEEQEMFQLQEEVLKDYGLER